MKKMKNMKSKWTNKPLETNNPLKDKVITILIKNFNLNFLTKIINHNSVKINKIINLLILKNKLVKN
jgi:hypothetical protein